MNAKRLRISLIVLVIVGLTPFFLVSMGSREEGPTEPAVQVEETEALPPPGSGKDGWQKPSEEKLRKELTSMQYEVTQHEGTEPAFNNEFWDNKEEGIYVDIVSGEPLFSSTDKYRSGTGWPSFTKPLSPGNITEILDSSYGMKRTEVRSFYGDSHLGHVFSDGPEPTGLRYCINSASLEFIPTSEMGNRGYGEYLYLFGMQEERLIIRAALPDWQESYSPNMVETAVFAGGCFWGVEAVFEQLHGVLSAESGYSGGTEETAYYHAVSSGRTNHAESVRVIYDPGLVDYETLLEVFFIVAHDPTQLNYQGPDKGRHYRSAIFYGNEKQKMQAEQYIARLNESMVYEDEIVTFLVPLKTFYPAEGYHQDFLINNLTHPYITYWDIPKLEDLKMRYSELLAVNHPEILTTVNGREILNELPEPLD